MPILSFIVPTRSRARVYVSADLLVHASDADATWRELADGRTILLVVCKDGQAADLRRLIVNAHPKVEDTTPMPRELPPRNSGVRRSSGRHRA